MSARSMMQRQALGKMGYQMWSITTRHCRTNSFASFYLFSSSSSSASSSACQPSSTSLSAVPYRVAKPHQAEEVVKKSRFIARVSPAKTFEDAIAFIEKVSDPKASHNCWALKVVSNNNNNNNSNKNNNNNNNNNSNSNSNNISNSNNKGTLTRSSDDGEPSGTAGRPILGAIEGEGFIESVVVVTRYFGGIELGTGGLSRAYASAARKVLKECERVEVVAHVMLEAHIARSKDKGVVYGIVTNAGAQRVSEGFVTVGVCVGVDVDVDVGVDVGVVEKDTGIGVEGQRKQRRKKDEAKREGEGEEMGERKEEGEGEGEGEEEEEGREGEGLITIVKFRMPKSKVDIKALIKLISDRTGGRVLLKITDEDD